MLEQENTAHASNILEAYKDLVKKGNNYNDNSETNICEIKKMLKPHTLERPIIHLGAGVSKDYGMPNWNELILQIIGDEKCLNFTEENGLMTINKDFENFLNKLSPDQWISFAGKIIEENSGRLEDIIIKKLYVNSLNLDKSTLLQKLITYWIQENKISGVITYNFDNILEQILNLKKHPNKSYSNQNSNIIDNNKLFNIDLLNIYHVHGYLPHNGEFSHVVMGETSYFDQYSNPLNWQNVVLLNGLIHYNNIFFGISMSDSNMRRVLSQSKLLGGKKHYLITKKEIIYDSNTDNIDIAKTNIVNEIKSQYFETLNIGLILLNDYELNSYDKIFS